MTAVKGLREDCLWPSVLLYVYSNPSEIYGGQVPPQLAHSSTSVLVATAGGRSNNMPSVSLSFALRPVSSPPLASAVRQHL